VNSSPAPVRHEWEFGWWEQVLRQPDPRLRGHVIGPYLGWSEQTTRALRRRETASGIVPLIINLGAAYQVIPGGCLAGETRTSFVAGLYETWVDVEGPLATAAIQVNFTPLGARSLLGVPMDALANRVVELEDLLGPGDRSLVERLRNTPAWHARFEVVETFLLRRLAGSSPTPAPVAWAWRQLEASRGRVNLAAVAREIGWSHRHFIAQVRNHVGLPPRTVARILRFQRAMALLTRPVPGPLSRIALDAGYCDQAHLNRDFTSFAGTTPTALLARRIPGNGGIAAGGT
jgi:AraC-like DNA-binding protein